MTKRVLLFVLLSFSFFLAKAQLPGSTCDNPIVVDPVNSPLVSYAINSQNYGNDYTSTMVTPSSNYLIGNDIVFQFTLSAKSYINASIQGSWTGLVFVGTCPNATTPAPNLKSGGGGSGATIATFTLEAGNYFMLAGTYAPPDFSDMIINFSAVPVPTDPTLTATPAELYVGMASPGFYAETKTLTLSNIGIPNAVINEGGFTFSGTNASEFSVTLNTGDTYPLTIAMGTTKIIKVTFNPAAAGTRTANLDITYNNPVTPVKTVPVSGLGYLPMSYFHQNFDGITPVPTGWMPDGWTKIVQSTSTSAYVDVKTSVPFNGTNQLTFSSSTDLNAKLFLVSPTAANFNNSRVYFAARMGSSSHTGKVQVGYLTSRTDPATFVSAATVSITGSWVLYSVDLKQSGITFPTNAYVAIKYLVEVASRLAVVDDIIFEPLPTQPIFNTDKATYNFGTTTWMYESSTQICQIYNSGVGTLILNQSDFQFAGADPTSFSIEFATGQTWPITLGFGQYVNTTLRFSPTEGRVYNALLNITDNITSKNVNVITLTGTGYDAMINPPFLFNFVGTFPPKDWRRFIGLFGTEIPAVTTETAWNSKKFANNTSLPATNSAVINLVGTNKKHWLMSPPVSLGDGSQNYQLEFDLALTAVNTTNPANLGTDQKFGVVFSTDGGRTWSTENALRWWNSTTPISKTGERIILDLSGYSGRVMFGFYGESTAAGSDVDLFFTNVEISAFQQLTQLPLNEEFESSSFPPLNWMAYNQDNQSPAWVVSTTNNHTPVGLKSAYHNKGAEGQAQNDWLVTPLMQMSSQAPYILKFWSYNNDAANYGKNSVLVSTGSGNPADGAFVEVWTTAGVSASWVETTVDLSAFANQTIYVAFRYEGTNAHEWYLDDVELFRLSSPVIQVNQTELHKTQVQGVTSSSGLIITNNGIENLVYQIAPEYLTGDQGWLSSNPANGNLQGGGFIQSHTISFNSTGLTAGVHTANLLVSSNDPANPEIIIPVSLTVNKAPIVEVTTILNSYNWPFDLSADGEYCGIVAFGGSSNYVWSKTNGLKAITGTEVSLGGVSDAGIVAGSYKDPTLLYNGNPVTVAGTWDPATSQWSFLGMNPAVPAFNYSSYQTGYGISADGITNVMMQYVTGSNYRAAKWTQAGGYVMIGGAHTHPNRPAGVNRGGNLIFGWAGTTAAGQRSPAIWTNNEMIMVNPALSGEATGASPSGNYATGFVNTPTGKQGFLWSADGSIVYFSNTLNPAWTYMSPVTVLNDGTIFGFINPFTVPPTNRVAFVRYTDGTMISFNEYALQRGLANANQWLFYSVNAATPDGNKFVGGGVNPQGQAVTFLIDFDVEKPLITINPMEINESLATGQTSVQPLTLENTGTADVTYQAFVLPVPAKKGNSFVQVPEGKIPEKGNLDLTVSKTNKKVSPEPKDSRDVYVLNYDGPNNNAIGKTAGGEFYVAARFPASLINILEGSTIQSVDVYIEGLPIRAALKIWGAGTTTTTGPLLHTQSFTPTASSWNTITLTTPLAITGEDIWVGYSLETAPQVYPAGIDGQLTNPDGNWISADAIVWEHISQYGVSGNWNIRASVLIPEVGWLSIDPVAGVIEPDESDIIQVAFDAEGLTDGLYNANILVKSNVAETPMILIPVELTVAYPEANILNYWFNATENPSLFADATGQIDLLNHSVTLEVQQSANLSDLIATFTLSEGVSAQVGGVAQVSGVTPNNFTSPVIYTLTTGAGNSQDWTVTVSTVPCLNPWSYLVTGSAHTITIPLAVAPEIFGVPLAAYDWIGVFYLNDNGEETCGGAVQWTGTGNVAIIAYGNDPTTTEKDGFAAGEAFRWRLSQCGNPVDYTAAATYDPTMPNQGNFAGFGLSKLTSLMAAHIQYFTLNQGWNGISGYLVPVDPAVQNMFAPIVSKLTILGNLTSVYWPSQGVNTIGNWNSNSGYAAKVTENVDFMIFGENYAQGTMTVPAGWSYLPVHSQCDASVIDMFGGHLSDVVIIQELIGTKVFWPAMGVYSLDKLTPGKAYKMKTLNSFTITFPACGTKGSSVIEKQINTSATPWGIINMSPASQVVSFMTGSMDIFANGDVIGAFGTDNAVYGFIEINDNSLNQVMTLFGNDATSADQNGFNEGQQVNYRLYRSSTGETFDVFVEYDQNLDNASGNYYSNSFAAIVKASLLQTDTGNQVSDVFQMYPNPASEIVHFTFAGSANQKVTVTVYDTKGRLVAQEVFANHAALNTSNLEAGVYVVNVKTDNFTQIRKLVIK
jgi:hypothetical protein